MLVVLQNRRMPNKGICFFSSCSEEDKDKVEYLSDGTHAYNVIAFKEDNEVEECQRLIDEHSEYPSYAEIEEYYMTKYRNRK